MFVLFDPSFGTRSVSLRSPRRLVLCLACAGKIDDQIQRYIGIKTLISAFVGLMVFVVLGPMLHLKLAHLFGVLTFLLNFIPNVGPVVATGTCGFAEYPPSLLAPPRLYASASSTLIGLCAERQTPAWLLSWPTSIAD